MNGDFTVLKFDCIREGVSFILEDSIQAGAWINVYKKVSYECAVFRDIRIYLKPDTKIRVVYLPA